ncbi:C39 family peptidase [Eggerthella sinensis]|uniref:C39 family peptidase n=1 Tax=Eggerthella sinensis TaxID=242230 RepID=UPI00266CFBBC|nr:C39 family peptidase [Eggerthella sinensis]
MSYYNSFDYRSPAGRTAPMRRMPPRGSVSYAAPAPRSRRSRSPLQLVAVLVLLAALAAAGWYAVSTLSGVVAGATPAAGASAGPQSTPRGDWRRGEVPALYQKDPEWAQGTYAEDEFGTTGCGPTCLAMVYAALTGATDKGPAEMGALSERMGCASPDGTAWTFMTEGAAELGLVATEVPADESSIRGALLSGSPVICSVGPGDFTTTGHFIVLTGIDGQGRLLIRDPNSPERTNRAWDFDTVLAQSRAIWAYSAA